MNVLLLFPLLLLRCRGQVIEVLASVSLLQVVSVNVNHRIRQELQAYQIVVGEVGDIRRLHAEILEGLGLGVDHLIHKLTLDLVGREGVPPEIAVEKTSDGLQEGLGNVDVSSLLEDLLVNHGSNLGQAVLLGSVELKGLTSGTVIVENSLQSSANIDRLGMLVKLLDI